MKRYSVSTRVLNKNMIYLNILLLTYFLSIAKKYCNRLELYTQNKRLKAKECFDAKKSNKEAKKLREKRKRQEASQGR